MPGYWDSLDARAKERRLAAFNAAKKPKTVRRTEAHIKGDILAAERALEKLQTELAATQPDKLTIRSWGCDAPIEVRLTSRRTEPHFKVVARVQNHEYTASDAHALQDWLNYHFPKEVVA